METSGCMMQVAVIVIAAAVVGCGEASTEPATDGIDPARIWFHKYADSGNTCSVPVSVAHDLALKWTWTPNRRRDSGLPVWLEEAPVFGADGRIYVAGDEYVFCLSPEGDLLWSHRMPPQKFSDGTHFHVPLSSIATTTQGIVFVGAGQLLHAVDANGKRMWSRYRMGDLLARGNVAPRSGDLIVGEGVLSAIQPTGEVRWQAALGPWRRGAPVAFSPEGTVYVTAWHERHARRPDPVGTTRFFIIDETGRVLHRVLLEGHGAHWRPIHFLGATWVATDAGRLYCIEDTGDIRWARKFEPAGFPRNAAASAVSGLYYLVWSQDPRTLFAVDQGGHVAWKRQFPGELWPQMAVDGLGNAVLCANLADGSMRVFAVSGHGEVREVYRQHTPAGPLSIGPDGRVYVRDLFSVLCLGTAGTD